MRDSSAEDWPEQEIGELLTLEYGSSLPALKRTGRGYPVFGSSGEVGRHSAALVDGPGIVVGRKGSVGQLSWTDEPFWPIDTTYYVRPTGPDLRWLYWSLLRQPLQRLDSSTGVPGLNRKDAYELRIGVPPPAEQRQIAEILDTLDEAIRKTEELIAKLKQVKQGLLHDLLTRGIDDNGELRDPDRHPEQFMDSPLGRIPKGWEASDLGTCAALVTSGSRGWARFYSDVGALFVRSQNVRMGHLDFADRQCVTPPAGSEGQRTKLERLDVLITITGNSVGNVSMVPSSWAEDAFVSQHVGLVRLVEPELAPFAVLYLISGSPGNQQILDAQYGQSKPGLNLDNLRGLRFPRAPVAERREIVERVSCIQWRLDSEQATCRGLGSLKRGLMEDLLTGRVRVTKLLEHADE